MCELAAAPISDIVGFLPAWYTILPLNVNLSCPLVIVAPPPEDVICNMLCPAFKAKYSEVVLESLSAWIVIFPPTEVGTAPISAGVGFLPVW